MSNGSRVEKSRDDRQCVNLSDPCDAPDEVATLKILMVAL